MLEMRILNNCRRQTGRSYELRQCRKEFWPVLVLVIFVDLVKIQQVISYVCVELKFDFHHCGQPGYRQ